MKRWITVIILAGLTGILMLGFLSGLANRVEVVVATHSLAVGQTITEADVELRPIHASAVHDDALTTFEDVIGKRLGQARLGGDQITQAALVGADNRSSSIEIRARHGRRRTPTPSNWRSGWVWRAGSLFRSSRTRGRGSAAGRRCIGTSSGPSAATGTWLRQTETARETEFRMAVN